MSDNQKEITDIIKREIEQKIPVVDIISDLIFSGFKYQEIERAFAELHQRGQISESAFREFRPQKGGAFIPPKTRKIEEEIDREEIPSLAGVIWAKLIYYKKDIIISLILLAVVLAGFLSWYFISFKSDENIIKRALIDLAEIEDVKFDISSRVIMNKNLALRDSFLENVLKEGDLIYQSEGVYSKNQNSFSVEIGMTSPASNELIWNVSAIKNSKGENYFRLNKISTPIAEWNQRVKNLLGIWIIFNKNDNPSDLYLLSPKNLLSFFSQNILPLPSADTLRPNLYPEDGSPFVSIVRQDDVKNNEGSFYNFKFKFSQTVDDKAHRLISWFFDKDGFFSAAQFENLEWDVLINKRSGEIRQINLRNFPPSSSLLAPQEIFIKLSPIGGQVIPTPLDFIQFDKASEYSQYQE